MKQRLKRRIQPNELTGGGTSCGNRFSQSNSEQWHLNNKSTYRWVAEVLIKCRVEIISIEVPDVVLRQANLVRITCGIQDTKKRDEKHLTLSFRAMQG